MCHEGIRLLSCGAPDDVNSAVTVLTPVAEAMLTTQWLHAHRFAAAETKRSHTGGNVSYVSKCSWKQER